MGDNFHKKFQILEEKKFHYILFHLILIRYNCSINLKRQSEHSRLRPDTSNLVIFLFESFVNFCLDVKEWSKDSRIFPDVSNLH